MRSPQNPFIICIFYIAWIFLGNFILLNLFLAILLDSFLEEDEENDDQEQIDARRKAKMLKRMEKQKRKEANKIFMGDKSKSALAQKKDE
jgi:hypothetical protein